MKSQNLVVPLMCFCALFLANVVVAQPTSFVETAVTPDPNKVGEGAASATAPVVRPRVVPQGAAEGTLTIFTVAATFDAMFPGLTMEDFEDGSAPPGGLTTCSSPVDENTNDACFQPGEIPPGVSFVDNPGPDDVLLLGPGAILNASIVMISNTFTDSFDIIFNPPVNVAGMDLHSTPALGQGPPDTVDVDVFDAGDVLIGTTTADASGAGDFFGVSSTTPIGRISILSQSNNAEGIDNIRFGAGGPVLSISSVTDADFCASDPANQNGICEPGELVEITVELTATGGNFTGITGTVSTVSPDVMIAMPVMNWPDMNDGDVVSRTFSAQLSEMIPCFSSLDFDIAVSSNEGGPLNTTLTKDIGQSLVPDVPQAIPDNDMTGVDSDLIVADDVILNDVNVRVEISHTWVGDLILTLTGPAGSVVLLDRPGIPVPGGAGCADDNMDVTFDDASGFDPETLCAGNDPWYVGDAAPVDALSLFNGTSSAGTWTLTVSDNAGADLGTIDNWELITDPPLGGVCVTCIPAPGGFDIEVPMLDKFGLMILLLTLGGAAIFIMRRRA